MTSGVETGNTNEKQVRRDDEKWLLEDLHTIKRTVEHSIASLQRSNERDKTEKKNQGKMLTIDRILVIGILGIF